MKLLTFFITFICFSSAFAQSEVDEMMYQAYLQRSKSLWRKAVETQQKLSPATSKDFNAQFRLAYVYASLLNGSMALDDEDFFDENVDDAKSLVKKLLEQNEKSGEAAALLSGIYGNEMGYSPMKGMILGSKSSSLVEKALELEPESPLVWRVYANNKFYTPAAFGGDLKKSINALEKSIALFELNPTQLTHNWLYIDTLAMLGQAYQKDGQINKAIGVYEKVLKAETNFEWVKRKLLPSAQNTLKK